MRRLVFALLLGLVVLPAPARAQGSVTLTVCNTGAVDIDVFVSSPPRSAFSSQIRPATCAAVAESAGGTQPAYVGLAFTDSRGQWGEARRFDGVPYMGSSSVLSRATRNEMVQRGNASVSLPLQLLFRPRVPQCVSTGTTVPDQGRIYVGRTVCEDLGYALHVEAYPDTREIRLASPPVSGAMASDGSFRISAKTDVNWAEEEAARKAREAPQPVNWSDLLPALRRIGARERLSSGEPLRLPGHVVIRGTVSAVEIRQQPLDQSFYSWRPPAPEPFDNTATIPVVEINFRESPPATGPRPYPEFNVCTERLDILTEQFGADFRTSMIGKVIEVRGIANLPGTVCWGQLGEIQLFLARQVHQVPSVQFAAGSRVWVPPPAAPPPPPRPLVPAPPVEQVADNIVRGARVGAAFEETRRKSRMTLACGEQHEKATKANPGNRVANDNEYFACANAVKRRPSVPDAPVDANQKAQACAQELLKAYPDGGQTDSDGFRKGFVGCVEALEASTWGSSAETPAPAAAPVAAPVQLAAPAAPPVAPADSTPAARAKALQDQQEREAQERLAARQKSAQEAKERAAKAQACVQQVLMTYPDGGRSDPAGFQTRLLACAQAQQAQPAAK